MEKAIWVDLGAIGHKSTRLNEIFRSEYLVEVPICNESSESVQNDKFVVFIDYTIGGSGATGTRVFSNAFDNALQFYKVLTEKLINEYVEINQPLDFKQNF